MWRLCFLQPDSGNLSESFENKSVSFGKCVGRRDNYPFHKYCNKCRALFSNVRGCTVHPQKCFRKSHVVVTFLMDFEQCFMQSLSKCFVPMLTSSLQIRCIFVNTFSIYLCSKSMIVEEVRIFKNKTLTYLQFSALSRRSS